MRSLWLLSLPTSLLLLISSLPADTIATETQWPYNLPAHVKYFPEHEHLVRKNAEIRQKLASRQPVGIRKMNDDEGEMFFMEYWQFGPGEDAQSTGPRESQVLERSLPPLGLPGRGGTGEDTEQWANVSVLHQLLPPFPLHYDKQNEMDPHLEWSPLSLRALFSNHAKRDFQCPTGTSACTSINQPNSCCATGETCQLITDTGLGDVGCCGQGLTCSGEVSNCEPGNSGCPSALGGGCCIPGFACVGVGCALNSTATVVVVPTVAASTSTSSSMTIAVVTTTVIDAPAPSSPSSSTSTSTSTSAPLTCSPAYTSCAASLGGGCCPTTMACGTSTSCLALSTSTTTVTAAAGAPVRPTSADTTTLTSQAMSTVTGTACPTGFYMCSAYYLGGCCRVGRDCSSTSCPVSTSTVLVNSDGVTVLAPTGTGVSGASSVVAGDATVTAASVAGTSTAAAVRAGKCAQGWFSCAASGGGGCCPSGYACGASCTATVSGVPGVGKLAASEAVRVVRVAWGLGMLVAGVGVGMVWL